MTSSGNNHTTHSCSKACIASLTGDQMKEFEHCWKHLGLYNTQLNKIHDKGLVFFRHFNYITIPLSSGDQPDCVHVLGPAPIFSGTDVASRFRHSVGKLIKLEGIQTKYLQKQQIASAGMEGSHLVLTHRLQFRLTWTCLLSGNNELTPVTVTGGVRLDVDSKLVRPGFFGRHFLFIASTFRRGFAGELEPSSLTPPDFTVAATSPPAPPPSSHPTLSPVNTMPVFVKLSSLTFRIPRLALSNLSSISAPPPTPPFPMQPFFTSGLGGSRRRPMGTRNTEC
ncbi:unnamed protein product [Scomber scombrus]|uniref:Unnamed protein product n=1 Tax=Scomber scombrus TaxID=13677 RepID=A0AAV1MQU8_SCOSC